MFFLGDLVTPVLLNPSKHKAVVITAFDKLEIVNTKFVTFKVLECVSISSKLQLLQQRMGDL